MSRQRHATEEAVPYAALITPARVALLNDRAHRIT